MISIKALPQLTVSQKTLNSRSFKRNERFFLHLEYFYLYPRGTMSDSLQDSSKGHESILLYDTPNKTIMRWYPVFYDNELYKSDDRVLVVSTHSSISEAILLYGEITKESARKVLSFNINYFKNEKASRSSEKIEKFIKKTYGERIIFADDCSDIFKKDVAESCYNSHDKYDLACVDIVDDRYVVDYPLFSSIVFSLKNLKKDGKLVFQYSLRLIAGHENYLKQLLFLLTLHFDSMQKYTHPLLRGGIFFIFKGFLGLTKDNYDVLLSAIEQWEKFVPTGGKTPIYSDNPNDTIKVVTQMFDFNYTKEFEKEFNLVMRMAKLANEELELLVVQNDKYNIDMNSEISKEFISEMSFNDLKKNIEMAHHYGLPVKPKYLDFDKKIEDDVVGHLFSTDRTIVRSFIPKDTTTDKKCDLRVRSSNISFEFKNLIKYKQEINMFKFMIETKDWKKFERIIRKVGLGYEIKKYNEMDESGLNIQGSRAFFKLYELFIEFPDLINKNSKRLNSLHICEAPGKFIMAVNNFVRTKTKIKDFKWRANSLNFEVAGRGLKDQYGYIKKYPHNWLFGEDNTGDITKSKNIRRIVEEAKKMGDIMFMTSDCGIDVSDDYNAQELMNSKLNLSHVIIALMALAEGGSAVFKVFLPMVENLSVSLVYLLYCKFKRISIVKQISGSPYNGEVYIVCQGFEGIDKESIDELLRFVDEFKLGQTFLLEEDFSDGFMRQYTKAIKGFVEDQKRALLRIFYLYDYPELLDKHQEKIDEFKRKKAVEWTKRMDVIGLSKEEDL